MNSNYEDFYKDLNDLMILHGIKSVKDFTCSLSAKGDLLVNKNHKIIADSTHEVFDDESHAVLQESLTDLALDKKDISLFKRARRGDIYSRE